MLENLPWEPLVNIIVTLHDFDAKGDRTLITHLHLTTKEIGFIIYYFIITSSYEGVSAWDRSEKRCINKTVTFILYVLLLPIS